MNRTCKDRDRIFEDGSAAEWAALEVHAASCAECAGEIRAWRAISAAAQEMRDYEANPALWARIASALAVQQQEKTRRGKWIWNWLRSLQVLPLTLQTAAAAALVLLLTVSAGLLYRYERGPATAADSHFLKSRALADVQRTESAYVQAIEKLAAETKPQLDQPDTPLLASYKEKLQVLDSAIDDLRTQADMNPSNAHLRYQLLAMYQEKQQTLEEVLEMKQ